MGTNKLALARNFEALIESHNLNITQTANELNLPIMTIRRLLSGETSNPRLSTLTLITGYFNVTIDQLINEEDIVHAQNKDSNPQLIPLLTWQEASSINTINELDLNNWKNWQAIPMNKEKLLKNAFALKTRPSFHSRFPNGTIFIIDPDLKAHDGDIVLVKIIDNNELTLREIYIDPPEKTLNSLIPDLNPIPYDTDKHQIIGVNILTMYYNKNLIQLKE